MQTAEISRKIGGNLDGVIQGISDSGDAIYAGYVVFLLGTVLRLKILMVIAAAVAIALVVFLAFIIKKPFQKMMKTLQEIAADWDMTKRFEVRGKDEAGSLAEFCNLTFEKIKSLLLVIQRMTVSLSSTGTDLTFNMQQTASSVTEIAAAIQNMKEQVNIQAGEAGKGFAVVAGEIRKLAENSASQSKTIGAVLKKNKTSIDSITQSTNIVIQGFETITEREKVELKGRSFFYSYKPEPYIVPS
jgi:methyl-accepting chemotaxis protein